MDLRKVKKLIELVEESGIAELEVTSGDESVRIAMTSPAAAATVISAPSSAPIPTPPAPSLGQGVTGHAATVPETARRILAPMSGTFYRAPTPEAEPFIEVGQVIEVGSVIGIIESMKMMHEIRSEEGGRVLEIAIENGTPVTTGDLLVAVS